jgi:hypothetical protein
MSNPIIGVIIATRRKGHSARGLLLSEEQKVKGKK